MPSPVEEFESLLKTVVTAKRLSQSKVAVLTDLALKNMKFDAQLVSALYRTHKSLLSNNKISSLYVFDALARAARHQAVKRNMSASVAPDQGNAATFMLKLQGVLEDLFADLYAVPDVPELKDKMKKVLDLWSKSSTFPKQMLATLTTLVNGEDSVSQVNANQSQSVDPRLPSVIQPSTVAMNGASTIMSPSTVAGASALPPALLALLGQTVQPQTPPSIPNPVMSTEAPTSQYTPAQIALLQQLAIAGGLVKAPSNVPSPSSNFAGPSNGVDPRAPPPPRQFSPRNDYYEDSPSQKGPYINGGNGNGRGRGSDYGGYRGGRGGRRGFDYHGPSDYGDPRRGRGNSGQSSWNTSRDNDSPYQRSSRSRSPPPRQNSGPRRSPPQNTRRHEDNAPVYPPPRRNIPPFSPKRPSDGGVGDASYSLPSTYQKSPVSATPYIASRPSIESQSTAIQQTRPPIPTRFAPLVQAIPTFESSTGISASPPQLTRQQDVLSSNVGMGMSTGKSQSLPLIPISSGENVPYLSQFDFMSYDFSQATAWEALGKSFQITNGYAPGQEELMPIVMMAMQTITTMQMQQQQIQGEWMNSDAIGGQSDEWQHGTEAQGASALTDTKLEELRPTRASPVPKQVVDGVGGVADDSHGDMSLSPPDSTRLLSETMPEEKND